MLDLLKDLSGTTVPTIFVIAGIVFLLLSIADKVYGELQISKTNRKYALAVGLTLLIIGAGIEILGPKISGAPAQMADLELRPGRAPKLQLP